MFRPNRKILRSIGIDFVASSQHIEGYVATGLPMRHLTSTFQRKYELEDV
jgi:hypothetical protein